MQKELRVKSTKKVRTLSYWQWRIFIVSFLCTFFINVTRRNFNVAISDLLRDLNIPKSDVGFLGSSFALSFSISKMVGGLAADYYIGPRWMLCGSLFAAGFASILFGYSSTVIMFTLCWTINGFAQGVGWIPVAKLLSRWFTAAERATWWTACSSAQTLGSAAIAFVGSLITEYYGWRYTMLIPGIFTATLAVILYFFITENPEEEGLSVASSTTVVVPTVDLKEKSKNNHQEKEQAIKSAKEQLRADIDSSNKRKEESIFWDYVLTNPVLWLLTLSSFALYIVRSGIHDWIVLMLQDSRGFTSLAGGTCLFWFEMFGFFGGFTASIMSDRLFKGNRVPVILYYTIGILFSTSLLWMNDNSSYFLNCAILSMLGFFIYGPQTLLGVAASELTHKKATGTALGLCWSVFWHWIYVGRISIRQDHGSIWLECLWYRSYRKQFGYGIIYECSSAVG